MDKKVMIGIIVVVVVALAAVAAFAYMNNNSDPAKDDNHIEIKQKFSVGDSHVMHVSGNMGEIVIDEDTPITIKAVNADGTYEVEVNDGEEKEIETMSWKEISEKIAPSIDDLNKQIKEQTGKDIGLKKTGTEVLKGTAFGDIKCDKYEFSYSESGSTIKVSAYLDCNKGILMKVDANYDLKELGKVSVNLVLKSSKMVGVTN
ncbi:MAG: hypothetical protein IKP61_04475 [Spirochaetales bacterium]|jgi:hypothetical protein|nr:hypothetical protein [Spirochaetales bacterium]